MNTRVLSLAFWSHAFVNWSLVYNEMWTYLVVNTNWSKTHQFRESQVGTWNTTHSRWINVGVFHNTTDETHQISVTGTHLLHKNYIKLLSCDKTISLEIIIQCQANGWIRLRDALHDYNIKKIYKYSESELGVRTPETASVLDVENVMMTDLTCYGQFQMNRSWIFCSWDDFTKTFFYFWCFSVYTSYHL